MASLIAVRTLTEDFDRLKERSIPIGDAIEANHKFLVATAMVVPSKSAQLTKAEFEHSKSMFLERYTAYSPKVTSPEIAELEGMWTVIVDEACAVIEDSSATVSSGVNSEAQYN